MFTKTAHNLPRLSLIGLFLLATIAIGIVTDERTQSLLLNTFWLSAGTCLLALPIGGLLAAYLVRTDAPGRGILGFCLAMLLFLPLYLQTAGWDAGFGLQGWWQADRLQTQPWLSGWRGAIWVHGIAAVPWVALIVGSALRSVNPDLEEMARLDGGPWWVFFRVTLPQCLSSVFVAAVFILITTAGEISVTDVFQIRTYAEELYIGYARDLPPTEGGVGELETTVFSACLVVAWLSLGALILWGSLTRSSEVMTQRPATPFRLGNWRVPVALLAGGFVLFVIGVPLANLVVKLGIEVEQIGDERIRRWSFAKAIELMKNAPQLYDRELGWTLAISQVSAIATIIAAVPLAWAACRSKMGTYALGIVIATALAIPGPALAILLIRFFSQPNSDTLAYLYDRTIAAPCIAMALRIFPWVTLVLWVAFRSIPSVWIEQARTDGAGFWTQMFRVVLPNRWVAVLCAWFVAVSLAAGELTTSILLVPPGVNTLAIRIFGLVHYGVEDRLAALCLWSTGFFVVLTAAVAWLGRGRIFAGARE